MVEEKDKGRKKGKKQQCHVGLQQAIVALAGKAGDRQPDPDTLLERLKRNREKHLGLLPSETVEEEDEEEEEEDEKSWRGRRREGEEGSSSCELAGEVRATGKWRTTMADTVSDSEPESLSGFIVYGDDDDDGYGDSDGSDKSKRRKKRESYQKKEKFRTVSGDEVQETDRTNSGGIPFILFKVYVQYLLHFLLTPDFCTQLRKSRDAFQYFYDPVSSVERALKGRRDAVLNDMTWRPDMKSFLDSYPSLDVADGPSGHECVACRRRGHPAAFQLVLVGGSYKPSALWEFDISAVMEEVPAQEAGGKTDLGAACPARVKVGTSKRKTVDVGWHCSMRSSVYHCLQHYKFHLLARLRWDIHRLWLKVPEGENRKESHEETLLYGMLDRKPYVKGLYNNFSGLIEEAELFLGGRMTAGRNVAKRWKRGGKLQYPVLALTEALKTADWDGKGEWDFSFTNTSSKKTHRGASPNRVVMHGKTSTDNHRSLSSSSNSDDSSWP